MRWKLGSVSAQANCRPVTQRERLLPSGYPDPVKAYPHQRYVSVGVGEPDVRYMGQGQGYLSKIIRLLKALFFITWGPVTSCGGVLK